MHRVFCACESFALGSVHSRMSGPRANVDVHWLFCFPLLICTVAFVIMLVPFVVDTIYVVNIVKLVYIFFDTCTKLAFAHQPPCVPPPLSAASLA